MHKFIFLTSLCFAPGLAPALLAQTPSADATKLFSNAPLRFEPSKSGDREFVTRGLRFQAAMSATHLSLRAGTESTRLQFAGTSANASIAPGERLPSKTNILTGNDRTQWRTGVANYRDLQVTSLYKGIGLHYYGNGGQLEYDLIVAPHADTGQVRLQFEGKQPVIDAQGNLTAAFLQKKPVSYQVAGGKRVSVESRYVQNADGTFGVRLGRYDASQELIIDPVLTFSAYLAGTGQDIAYGIGQDSQGRIYVGGTTAATDFTTAGNGEQVAAAGSFDAFVAVLDPTPNAPTPILYTTYYGGTGAELVKSIYVSQGGIVYLTGATSSTDLPLAGNSVQTTMAGSTDAFIAVIDPSQASDIALVYATYLGGTKDETAYTISVDAKGLMYVAGDTDSTDFPTNNPYQSSLTGNEDMFIAVLDPNQSSSIFTTYFGGSGTEFARGIAPLADGTFWLTGGTYSSDFPIGGNPYNFNYNAGGDMFLARLDPTQGASALLYGTFLGGSSQDVAQTLKVDPTGRLVISGLTASADFPVTSDALQPKFGGGTDAFVLILDPSLAPSRQLVYSTYYGGRGAELPTGLVLDATGILHLAGYTSSTNLILTSDAAQPRSAGGYDGFYVKINTKNAGGAGLSYGTYVGSAGTQIVYGLAVDSNTNVYLAGYTTSDIFANFTGPLQTKGTAAGDADAFVLGLSPCAYALSAASNQFPKTGGTFSLVLSGGKDCSWTITNPFNWVQVTPATGTNGNATLVITVLANTLTTGRTGTILIAGVPFLIAEN